MKRIGVLNQPLSAAIASLGHEDTLVIADAGLPIPRETERIDLALKAGTPSFLKTLRAVLREMEVERVIVSREMLEVSPDLYEAASELLGEVPVEMVTHRTFKKRTRSARAVVRTGEFTPYANIILTSGVVF